MWQHARGIALWLSPVIPARRTMRTGEVIAIIAAGIVAVSGSSVWIIVVITTLLYTFGVKLPLLPSLGVGKAVAIGLGIGAIYSPCLVSLGYLAYFLPKNKRNKQGM